MLKKMTAMMFTVMLVLVLMIPSVSFAEKSMYVYTENGGSLNIRTEPWTGDNVIKQMPFGSEVYVIRNLGNGWTELAWGGMYDYAYCQTRFLVSKKPAKKPTPKKQESSGTTTSVSIDELNRLFKTYKLVDCYRVTVRPTRASGWVNVRFAPTKQAELLSTHKDNEQLIVIAELNGWYQVENPDTGAVGYVNSAYVVEE